MCSIYNVHKVLGIYALYVMSMHYIQWCWKSVYLHNIQDVQDNAQDVKCLCSIHNVQGPGCLCTIHNIQYVRCLCITYNVQNIVCLCIIHYVQVVGVCALYTIYRILGVYALYTMYRMTLHLEIHEIDEGESRFQAGSCNY